MTTSWLNSDMKLISKTIDAKMGSIEQGSDFVSFKINGTKYIYRPQTKPIETSKLATQSKPTDGDKTGFRESEIRELQFLLMDFDFYDGLATGKINDETIKAADKAKDRYNLPGNPYGTDKRIRRDLLYKLRELKKE